MFIPVVQAVQRLYPTKKFKVLTIKKQTDLFRYFGVDSDEYVETSPDKIRCENGVGYFDIVFNMSDGSQHTKAELCAIAEIGIDPKEVREEYGDRFPISTNLVGVHFSNTCLPNGANPTQENAQKIWQSIEDSGLIPIEINFIHDFYNPVNKLYDFVRLTTRGMPCKIENLAKTLLSCKKFVGVNSGPFFMALRLLGANNVMMLERDYKLSNVVRTNCQTLDIRGDVDVVTLRRFLQ